MTYEEFIKCFEYMCNSFDLNYNLKQKSLDSYFNAFKWLSLDRFKEVVDLAANEIDVKQGYLPTIKNLKTMLFSGKNEHDYLKELKDSKEESFRNAICQKCNRTGFVFLSKIFKNHTYDSVALCDCEKGRMRANTVVGRSLKIYTEYLSKDYVLSDDFRKEEVPF